MTAVSTLRDDLTFIVSVSMIYFLKLTLPQYHVSHSFLQQAFTKKIPRIHADPRNSKNIRGFVNTLKVLESAWFVGFYGKSLPVLAG